MTFDQAVYQAVKRLGWGEVATYGQIALWIGRPRAARQVGGALSRCSDGSVPCHRVVNRQGRTAPGFAAQRGLLKAEGVPFLPDGRVDLVRLAQRGGNDGKTTK